MMTIKPVWIMYGVGAGVALLALNALLSGRIISGTAGAVARLPGDLVIGGAEGLLGLPDPRSSASMTECERARLSGDDFRASFYCPAKTWIGGLFDGK